MAASILSADFPLTTLVFTIYNDVFRSSKIKRIVIDEKGTYYVLEIDGTLIERDIKSIDKTKEGLFNKLVEKFIARQCK